MATDEPFTAIEEGELEELRGRLTEQRQEFIELVEDVRERVIQVKRETDGKAPADHDHPDLTAQIDQLETELATLEETMASGFENFETVLESLVDETDTLDERATILAKAVVDLRERERTLTARDRRRAEADQLKRTANRMGVGTATCGNCEGSVNVALLTAPACPHCQHQFADVETKRSLFGSHRLVTGEPPALEGTTGESATDGVPVFEAVAEETPEQTEPDSAEDSQ